MFTGCSNLRTVYGPDAYNEGSDGIALYVLMSMTSLANELGFEYYYDAGLDYLTYRDFGETCAVTMGVTGSACISIPTTICGKSVTKIDDNCFGALNQEETTVKIPSSVVEVGSNAFTSKVSRIIWLTEESSSNLNVATDAFDSSAEVICLENKGLYNLLNTTSYNVQLEGIVHTSDSKLNVAHGDATIFGYVEVGWENVKEYNYSGANGNRTRIYHLAFANNTAITKIDVTGWSNLTTIGNGAFVNCTNLTEVKLPNSVTTIGIKAFSNCDNLKTLVLSSNVTSIGKYAFDGMTGVVYYPSSIKSLIDAYEGTFSNFVEIKLDHIAITTAPTKTSYIEGENFAPAGMVVTATYNDGSTKVVTNYTVTDGENLEVGKTNVTISYTENGVTKIATQAIAVVAKELSSIAITSEPSKKDYVEGENFAPEGMEVTATYSDGSTKVVTNYTVTDGEDLEVGKTNVTISYTEGGVTKIATQAITVQAKVIEKTLSSIAITSEPSKKDYVEGENFAPEGMVVTATYSDGSTKVVTNYTVTDGENLAVGKISVTISYTEGGVTETATQAITVTEKVEEENILKDDSKYKIEKDEGVLYITDIMPKTAIEKFKEQLKTGYEIELYDINENKITDDNEYVKTNTKMIAKKDGETVGEYILVVIGDCNGSGTTNVSDLTKLMMSIAESLAQTKDESKILKGAYEKAVDLNGDGKINSVDITRLLMYIAENK